MNKELTCINCPMGCRLQVEYTKNEILKVTGNTCPRGIIYAAKEIFHPERIVTTTVKISGAEIPLLPVKTSGTVPKELTFKVMELAIKANVEAPVKVGDIIISNILDTGVDLVATRNL